MQELKNQFNLEEYKKRCIVREKEDREKYDKIQPKCKCGMPIEYKFWLSGRIDQLCTDCFEKEQIRENIQRLFKNSNIPTMFKDVDINSIRIEKNKKIIENYNKGGLYLRGNTGVGKTHIAVCIMKRLIEQSIPAVFISIPELLLEIRDTFKGNNESSELQIIDEYGYTKKTVVFDDIGSEKVSDWSLQTLYLIIDRRYREILPTIVTSNLSLDELSEKLSDRIASRIAGMCEIIEIKGDDQRLKFKGVK